MSAATRLHVAFVRLGRQTHEARARCGMTAAIAVEGLVAGYGPTVVLDDLSFALPRGGSLAVLGRNGAGKTTLLGTLMGFTTWHAGRIRFDDRAIERSTPYDRNRLGLGYVPQEREIFRSLTVEENLAVFRRDGGWPIERIYALFPALKERSRDSCARLSGGEQQMLAIGRALVGAPKVLLLDEPAAALAPRAADALYDALQAICDSGELSIILVERKAELALKLADRVIVLDGGRIVHAGASADLLADVEARARLLGADAGRSDLADEVNMAGHPMHDQRSQGRTA
jgi:branched-chain amino acid transport system ATP-binding protein